MNSVHATPFTPQGNIELRNIYAIDNATFVNGTLGNFSSLYQNNSPVCTGVNGICNVTATPINGTPVWFSSFSVNTSTLPAGNVAYINGNETILGDLNVVGNLSVLNVYNLSVLGNIYPGIDAVFSLGTQSLRWLNANFAGQVNATQVFENGVDLLASLTSNWTYTTGLNQNETYLLNNATTNWTYVTGLNQNETNIAGNLSANWTTLKNSVQSNGTFSHLPVTINSSYIADSVITQNGTTNITINSNVTVAGQLNASQVFENGTDLLASLNSNWSALQNSVQSNSTFPHLPLTFNSSYIEDSVITQNGTANVTVNSNLTITAKLTTKADLSVQNSSSFGSVINDSFAASSKTINWAAGNKQEVYLNATTATIKFNPPNGPASMTLLIQQNGTGGNLITWPSEGVGTGNLSWANKAVIVLSTGANAIDEVTFLYNGTCYFAMGATNFG